MTLDKLRALTGRAPRDTVTNRNQSFGRDFMFVFGRSDAEL
jgi:hypothetical protein